MSSHLLKAVTAVIVFMFAIAGSVSLAGLPEVRGSMAEGAVNDFSGVVSFYTQLVGEYEILNGDDIHMSGLIRPVASGGPGHLRAVAVYAGGVRFLMVCDEVSTNTIPAGGPDLRLMIPRGIYYSVDGVTNQTMVNGQGYTFNNVQAVANDPFLTIFVAPDYQINLRLETTLPMINLYVDKTLSVPATGILDGNTTITSSVLNFPAWPSIETFNLDPDPWVAEGWNYAATATSAQSGVTYAWDLDGDGQYNDAPTAGGLYTFAEPGPTPVSLIVSNGLGFSTNRTALVCVRDRNLERFAYTIEAAGITGKLWVASHPPIDGTNSFAVDYKPIEAVVNASALGTFFSDFPNTPGTYVSFSNRITAINLNMVNSNEASLGFSLNGGYYYDDPFVSGDFISGVYTLKYEAADTFRTFVLGGDLEGAYRVRIPAAGSDTNLYCGCEPAERAVIEINGETFDVFPGSGGINNSSNLIGSLLLEPRDGGFNLLLNPDGTYARVAGGVTNETGVYSLTALEDYGFDVLQTGSNHIGVVGLAGLEYVLETSADLEAYIESSPPIPGVGNTIQFAPDRVNTTGFFRIRAR